MGREVIGEELPKPAKTVQRRGTKDAPADNSAVEDLAEVRRPLPMHLTCMKGCKSNP